MSDFESDGFLYLFQNEISIFYFFVRSYSPDLIHFTVSHSIDFGTSFSN
jgi:hypothetical protein